MKYKVLYLSTSLLLWILLVLFHLFWYVKTNLANAFDGYNNDWRFQALAFAFTTLPYYILGLGFFLIIELSILGAIDPDRPRKR